MEYAPTAEAKLGTLIPGTGIAVGNKAPDARALNLDGKETSLRSLLPRGPLLLVFYRGGWCPFCNFQIRELTTAFPEYKKRGILPVAVSVDRLDEAAKTKAAYEIPFPVLSDPGLSFVEAFRVAKKVDSAEFDRLKGFGIDLERASGKIHRVIPIPSLFLIGRDGTVRWAHSDHDYKTRPKTAQILRALDAVTAK